MASIALDHVSKRYSNGTLALAEVCCEVADGQLAVLVGPSGSGKSTLLRVLAGLETQDTGRLLIGGKEVTGVPPSRRGVALVFQRPALYPHLAVRENISFGEILSGKLSAAELATRVGEMADLLELQALLDRRPAELSGGEQQRVALGRALLRRPAVALLDEPLSNLDGPLRAQMRRQLHLLQRRFATTMILVTHDQAEALALADHLIVLHGGVVQQAGPPLRVFGKPANRFVASFLGTPPMNLLEGRLLATESGWALAHEGGLLLLPSALPREVAECRERAVVLGVRAENVSLGSGLPDDGPASVRAWGTVETVELLGAEALVVCRLAHGYLTARADSSSDLPQPGCEVELGFAVVHAHWFDAVSGRALREPGQ